LGSVLPLLPLGRKRWERFEVLRWFGHANYGEFIYVGKQRIELPGLGPNRLGQAQIEKDKGGQTASGRNSPKKSERSPREVQNFGRGILKKEWGNHAKNSRRTLHKNDLSRNDKRRKGQTAATGCRVLILLDEEFIRRRKKLTYV